MQAISRSSFVYMLSMAAFLVTVLGELEEVPAPLGSPNYTVLCISKCSTCPTLCATPPPPPTPTPPTPSLVLPSPPPPHVSTPPPPPLFQPPPKSSSSSQSSSLAPASPTGTQKGGLSYPYYYFYTSGAIRSIDLVPSILGKFLAALMCLALFSM